VPAPEASKGVPQAPKAKPVDPVPGAIVRLPPTGAKATTHAEVVARAQASHAACEAVVTGCTPEKPCRPKHGKGMVDPVTNEPRCAERCEERKAAGGGQ